MMVAVARQSMDRSATFSRTIRRVRSARRSRVADGYARGRYGPVVRIYTTRCGDSSSPSLYGDAILVVWSGLDLYPP